MVDRPDAGPPDPAGRRHSGAGVRGRRAVVGRRPRWRRCARCRAELRQHPVAWVLARSDALHDDAGHLFDLLEKDGAVRMSLARLGQDAVTALLTDALGGPPDSGLLALAEEAAGNPSLLAELAAGLREDDAVRVTDGQATPTAGRLPRRLRHLARRRLDGLGQQARNLLVTAAVLGPSFPLEDAAAMLGETSAALLPAVEEMIAAGLLTAADDAFCFRHELLRRAVLDTIPPPALTALHRQYGQLLLGRGGAADAAAAHLLRAAHRGSPASLADLDAAVARTLPSAPPTAADLAVRVLELTPAGGPDELPRAVAAAEALAAAGRTRPGGQDRPRHAGPTAAAGGGGAAALRAVVGAGRARPGPRRRRRGQPGARSAAAARGRARRRDRRASAGPGRVAGRGGRVRDRPGARRPRPVRRPRGGGGPGRRRRAEMGPGPDRRGTQAATGRRPARGADLPRRPRPAAAPRARLGPG